MSSPDEDLEEQLEDYNDENAPKLMLRHSNQRNKSMNKNTNIFDSVDIEARSATFDICAPGSGTGDAILALQNPGLLAFRNKSSKGARPNVKSPKSKSRGAQPGTQSTLLAHRRPLTALKEPEIPALEFVKKQVELEKQTISFKEDPVAYFSKRKDGRGHRFIYLVYKGDPSDPFFSPYELDKVPYAEIVGDYFTMSATGVTHVHPDGTTETISLDLWARQKSIFDAIRRLKTFSQFFFWKQFRIWRNFVMHERYNDLDNKIVYHPFFRNRAFFSRALMLYDLQSTSNDLLKKYLLAFQSQRKYKLIEYVNQNKENIEQLKYQYEKFILDTQSQIKSLYESISDPKLVQVHDSDFPDIRRRNPNLAQLMVLEKRKAAKRAAKTEAVNREIMAIGGFIRMIDYMLLEALSDGCVDCWKIADKNVSQEQASVFQVEVLFDDNGKVAFTPTLDDLLESISTSLHESIKTLNTLPRLLSQAPLRPLLRDNGLDLSKLFDQGPQFYQIVSCSNILEILEKHILDTVTTSYKEAFSFSQSFSDFYPIFKLGKTWNVRDYIITRSGKLYEGPITDTGRGSENDDFLINPDDEPIVDFERVVSDIKQFQNDSQRVANLRGGAVRGALHIDSRGLKATLTPIPQRALLELQELLRNLANMKIEMISRALKYYGHELKQEPPSLESYVAFCEIYQRTIDVTPQIESEISFVDKMFDMFDQFNFTHPQNSLHTAFRAFKSDQETAKTIRQNNLGIFTTALRDLVSEMERKISNFYEKATSIPTAIKDADIETRLPASQKLVTKINNIEPRVKEIIRYQSIIQVQVNNFSTYKDVLIAAEFSVKLYQAIEQWLALNTQMTQTPFANIDMGKFHADMDLLKENANKLQESAPNNYPILNELITKISETAPFVEQLELLSHGKMQQRHWNMLFEDCERQNAYHPDITIDELLNLGILRARDKIEQITATSQGESELEAEFISITTHWNKVQMPLLESQIKMEETLLLGPTEPLLNEIQNTLHTLQRMLSLPYVQGIRDSVSNLTATLENLSQIIEAWQLFQSNWVVLSALFGLEEARSILPHQANRFTTVQRKWTAIARHTLKDTRLFSVCAYPALLEVLNENNSSMESILASLGKFLDTKRAAMPRLYFLSNDEVLALATTSDFVVFTSMLSKLFMNVEKLDCHEHDGGDGEQAFTTNNLQRLKIYGLIGKDGDTLQFQRYVQCNQTMEVWMNQLIETMKQTVKDMIITSIPGCTNGSFTDWIMSTPTYIAIIVLHIVFCKEIEECFSTYETNPRSFSAYEATLKRRIEDTSESFLMNLSAKDEKKLSTILTLLLGFRDRFKAASDKNQNHSPYLDWLSSLRYRFMPNSGAVQVEFSDCKWDHGYEYWGKVPSLIHTPQVDTSMANLSYSLSQHQLPMITSSSTCGKQIMARSLACMFGSFCFVVRPFPDMSEYFMSRLLIGAAASGSMLVFNDIQNLTHKSLAYLFDNVRSLIASQVAGNPRITISTRLADLNKTCRIVLTAHSDYVNNDQIPPQLKSFCRPIALTIPSYAKLIETYLISIGFRDFKVVAPKLINFVQSIQTIIQPVVQNPSLCHHYLGIISQANEIIHKMRVTMTEDLALAYSCYDRYIPLCDKARLNLLMHILWSSFQIGSNVNDMMEKFQPLITEELETKIRQAIEKEISALGLEVPSAYLLEQAVNLFHLLRKNSCIIIAGPPNSGKSVVLDLVSKIFNRQIIPDTLPIQLIPLFPQGDSWGRVFGHVYEDITIGPMYAYGQVQAALHYLSTFEATHQRILKFDGMLTPEFTSFLTQFFGSPDLEKLMLNSLDTFAQGPNFHVIVETDDLSTASPALLSKCGILVMRSVQTEQPIMPALPACELLQPNYPFARAAAESFDCVDPTNLGILKNIFGNIAPSIVKRIYHTPNCLCYSESPTRVPNGHVILSEMLPKWSAMLAMRNMDSAGIDKSNEDQVKELLVLSFLRIFSSIIAPEEIAPFDTWLRTSFDINVPQDWVGFNVSDAFWNVYQKPSLLSMRFYHAKLMPLNFEQLEAKPIYTARGEDQLPFIPSNLTFNHAQMLPQLQTSELLVHARQNFVVHGPIDSGKSSFLKVLFRNIPNIFPIIIPANNTLNGESVISYLATHSPLISKSLNSTLANKTYAIVFEGLRKEHTQLMEFIRMIITTHTIPLYSANDQKVFEFANIHPFFVVITTRDYSSLPSRFLTHFTPIQLNSITEATAQYIGSRIMETYGFNKDKAVKILKLASLVFSQYKHKAIAQDLLKLSNIFCLIEDKENDVNIMLTVLFDLYYETLHRYDIKDYLEKVTYICKSECKTDEERNAVDDFLEFTTLFYPTYDLSKDLKTFKVEVGDHPVSKLIEELNYYQTIYNANAIEKIMIRFTPYVLKEWMILHRAVSCPGRNVVLRGRTGSGRFTMTRFIAHMCEQDFIHIAQPTAEEYLAPEDRLEALYAIIRDVVNNTVIQQKRTVIFIRATQDTAIEAQIISDFISRCDFHSYFSKQGLEELYGRFSSAHTPTFEHRIQTSNQIKNLLALNITVVIAIDQGVNLVVESNQFDTLYFNTCSTQIFNEISNSALEATQTKKVTGSVSQHLQKLLPKIAEIARQKVPNFHLNMFYDFIDSFAHFAAADYQDIVTKNENIQSALDFISRLESESHTIDKRLDSLAPTLQRLQVDSESLQSSYTTRKEAIETRRAKLQEDHASKTAEVELLDQEVGGLEAEREALVPRMQQTMKDVEKLSNNDIETIRITAADPLPSLRLLLEVFCLFLDLPPSYERSGQKLLMDPQFVTILVSRIGKNPISPQLMANVQPYFESEEMNPTELESIAPALRSLYDWVDSVCRLAALDEKLIAQKKIMDEKHRSLNEYIEEMNLEIASIEQVEASLENESKALVQSNASREQMEKEYKAVDSRKKSLDAIFKGIDQFTERWQLEAKDFTSKRERLIGNSILFAFYLVFCGSMDTAERVSTLNEVKEEIKLAGIDTSYEDPLQSIADRFIAAHPEEYAGKGESVANALDAHHVLSTLRTPLLVDPDGIITKLVSSTIKPKKLVTVSQNISTLDVTIASAISDGKTLILFDVNSLNPIVATILALDLLTPDQHMSMEIRIGSKLVTWDPKFKLILVSNTVDVSTLPDQLLSRVSLINVTSSSLDTTYSYFVNTFIDFFAPELSPKLQEMQSNELNQRVQITKYERDILDILADIVVTQGSNPAYDYLADEATISDLIKSKEAYINAVSSPIDHSSTHNEMKEIVKPFKKSIKLCHIFWRVMSRYLPKINKSAFFSFSAYQKHVASVFVNDGLHPGTLSSDQHTALQTSLTTATFQFIFQSLPISDAMFFMFMSAYLIKEDNEKLGQQDLDAVIDHIRAEFYESCSFQPPQAATGETFEHLKYTNIINIFHFISRFIVEQFGPDYSSFLPHFQVDSIITNSASIPSIICAPPRVDPTALVQHFIGLRCRHENLDAISLTSDLELIRNTRKVILTALNRGNWVLIHYSIPSRAAAGMLTDIFTQMTTTSVNTNFRLIILASSFDYLSPSMIMKSKRINVELYPSIRNSMLQLFHHHSASIRSTTNPRAMKKLAYASALLLSMINFRKFVTPFGFNTDVRPNDLYFRDIIEQLRLIIDAHPNDVPLKNLRSQLENLIYSFVPDLFDRRRIAAHIATVIVQDALDDGFTLTKHSKEAEKWTIPADIPLSNFTQIIQQLPLFPTTEVLQMGSKNVMTVRNWNMSIWISRPFLTFSEVNKPINYENARTKIDNFIMMLPEKIGTGDMTKYTSIMGMYLLTEAEKFNDIILYIRTRSLEISKELKADKATGETLDFAMNQIPTSWKSKANVWFTRQINSFATHLIERHAQLMRCIQEGSPVVFDIRLLDNVKALLDSYLMDIALSNSVSSDSLGYEFELTDGSPDVSANALFLTRATLACGEMVDGNLKINEDSKVSPFKPISAIIAKVKAKRGALLSSKAYQCPIYKQAYVPLMGIASEDLCIIEGESSNFVGYASLNTELTETSLLRSGTAIFCRIPEQLM